MSETKYITFMYVNTNDLNHVSLIELGQRYPNAKIEITDPDGEGYCIKLMKPIEHMGPIISGPGKL